MFFKESEFKCNCGCNLGYSDMDESFVIRLDIARGHAEVPFRITSSIRCEKHNTKVGGKKNSAHPKGEGADIEVISSYERFKIIAALIKVGFNRIGIGENFIHVDDDTDKPKELCWLYDKESV